MIAVTSYPKIPGSCGCIAWYIRNTNVYRSFHFTGWLSSGQRCPCILSSREDSWSVGLPNCHSLLLPAAGNERCLGMMIMSTLPWLLTFWKTNLFILTAEGKVCFIIKHLKTTLLLYELWPLLISPTGHSTLYPHSTCVWGCVYMCVLLHMFCLSFLTCNVYRDFWWCAPEINLSWSWTKKKNCL